jgi:uncharacterized protein (DUF58 family)
MRFTRLGRDYFAALLLVAGAGLVEAQELFAGLALAMAATSLMSAALLGAANPGNARTRVAKPDVRLFKGEEGKFELLLPNGLSRWVGSEILSAKVDRAGSSGTCVLNREKTGMSFRLSVSGRFRNLSLEMKLTDSLGLFVKSVREVRVPVQVDSLPLSLLQRTRPPFVPPLVLGESPGGTAGRGQEFYGIEEYNERSESKDIMWKRAARAPESPLMARVRESNIPERVLLTVVQGEIPEEERAVMVDLQCEALGALGSSLLGAGVKAEIVCPDGHVVDVEDEEGLARGVLEASARDPAQGFVPEVAPSSNIVVLVGRVDEKWSRGGVRVPEVLVGGEARKVRDRYVASFSGFEDLTPLVSLVLSS